MLSKLLSVSQVSLSAQVVIRGASKQRHLHDSGGILNPTQPHVCMPHLIPLCQVLHGRPLLSLVIDRSK